MNKPHDPNRPTEVLIDQTEDPIDCAAAGNSAFTPIQIVNTLCNFVLDIGVFRDESKVWSKLEKANQNGKSSAGYSPNPAFTCKRAQALRGLHDVPTTCNKILKT